MAANDLTHNQLHQHQHQHQVQLQVSSEPPDPLTITTQNKYDDASSTSSSPTRKPLNSFDDDLEVYDLEDGFKHTQGGTREGYWNGRKGNSWWGIKDIMTVRSRRKGSVESVGAGYKDESGGVPFLASASVFPRRSRRRGWYNYCIFGGISGLTILAILLTINLLLTLTTLFWAPEDDDAILRNWGAPGTTTAGLSWYPTDFTRDIVPIACHSHNDYWRRVPLFSALRHGCTGVEADVWLFDDDLYVGHNTASLTRNRTFTSLYIAPLVRILEEQNPNSDFYNGTMNGVFDVDHDQTLTLLIDVKTSGAETWPWILKQLEPLRERGWLSFVEGETVHTRPVTVVGTGNTPFDILTQNTTYRDTFFDAPLDTMWEPRSSNQEPSLWSLSSPPSSSPSTSDTPPSDSSDFDDVPPPQTTTSDLGQGLSGTSPNSSFTSLNSYYASVQFQKAVGRIWRGRLSPRQMGIIRGQVRGAHRRGLKARYWDLPAWPLGLRDHVWDVLVKEGVDVLNVDDLRAASRGVW